MWNENQNAKWQKTTVKWKLRNEKLEMCNGIPETRNDKCEVGKKCEIWNKK